MPNCIDREDGRADEGLPLLILGAILIASVVLALGAARTGVPVLVAFLGLGMLLGSDGLGGIDFADAKLAREIGIVGLALIPYEGDFRRRGGGCTWWPCRRRCSALSSSAPS